MVSVEERRLQRCPGFRLLCGLLVFRPYVLGRRRGLVLDLAWRGSALPVLLGLVAVDMRPSKQLDSGQRRPKILIDCPHVASVVSRRLHSEVIAEAVIARRRRIER